LSKAKHAAVKRPVRGLLHQMLRRATRMDDQTIVDFLRDHKIEDATIDDLWAQAVEKVMTDLGHPDLVPVAKRLRLQRVFTPRARKRPHARTFDP
jgi:hypothetical protein